MQQQLVEGSMTSRDENMTRKETHMGQRPLSSINWSGVKLIYCAARYIDKSIYQLTRMKNKTSLIFALMQRYDKYSDHISVSRLTVARFMRPIWLSCKTIQHHAILCNTIQYHAIPCNIIQYYAILCNTIQYHAILYSTMQYHAILYQWVWVNSVGQDWCGPFDFGGQIMDSHFLSTTLQTFIFVTISDAKGVGRI